MTKQKKSRPDNGKHNKEAGSIDIQISDEAGINAEAEAEKSNEAEKEVNELKEQLLRKAAEFENYKKRTVNERAEFFAYASERLIIELLPVVDDFDRVMKSYDEKHDAELFKKGVDLIFEKLLNTLEKQGLKEIESTGKEFDVNLHEAILQQPNEELPSNTVMETAEKGYFLKDKVLRHAKVVVSTKPE
jgi:molecular chaperone GrpE